MKFSYSVIRGLFQCLFLQPWREAVLKVRDCPFSSAYSIFFCLFLLPHHTPWLSPGLHCFFHSSCSVSSVSFCLLSLPQITQMPTELKRPLPLSTTLIAFSKTRAPHACSPLGLDIQTDLLCWGVISTVWPPLYSSPASLGPPTAGDWCQQGILSHVSFYLLQTHPAPKKHLLQHRGPQWGLNRSVNISPLPPSFTPSC